MNVALTFVTLNCCFELNTEYFCGQGEIIHYDRATVSYHSFARNTLVERMEGDFLLMLDTDHILDSDEKIIVSKMRKKLLKDGTGSK